MRTVVGQIARIDDHRDANIEQQIANPVEQSCAVKKMKVKAPPIRIKVGKIIDLPAFVAVYRGATVKKHGDRSKNGPQDVYQFDFPLESGLFSVLVSGWKNTSTSVPHMKIENPLDSFTLASTGSP